MDYFNNFVYCLPQLICKYCKKQISIIYSLELREIECGCCIMQKISTEKRTRFNIIKKDRKLEDFKLC